jgi:hypothetical protein
LLRMNARVCCWSLPCLLGALLALAGCGSSNGSNNVPVPNPNPAMSLGVTMAYQPAPAGFGYPAPEQTLEQYLAELDVNAMRQHAWDDWAAFTARTSTGLPVMFTWYQNREIFGAGTIGIPRTFLPQFLAGPVDSLGEGNPPVSFNVYNQAYRDHVRDNDYQWRDTLTALVGQLPVVADFPDDAVAVKTVWWPVRSDGLTAFPVWDDAPVRPIDWGTGIGLLVDQGYFGSLTPDQAAALKGHERHGNEWGTFQRVVAIDPSHTVIPAGQTASVKFFDTSDLELQQDTYRTANVVPLQNFPHVQLNDPTTVANLNGGLMGQLAQRFWGRPLAQGDYLALVAIHVTTRETADWVWITLWWHDQPNAAPYGNDRPANVVFPYNQFRMEVAQSADVPVGSDGGANITFNPYLEAGFALGVQSNCIGCHQRAAWTSTGPGEVYPAHRGTIGTNDPFFAGKLRTHLLWSLVFRPRPKPQESLPPLAECGDGFLCGP